MQKGDVRLGLGMRNRIRPSVPDEVRTGPPPEDLPAAGLDLFSRETGQAAKSKAGRRFVKQRPRDAGTPPFQNPSPLSTGSLCSGFVLCGLAAIDAPRNTSAQPVILFASA